MRKLLSLLLLGTIGFTSCTDDADIVYVEDVVPTINIVGQDFEIQANVPYGNDDRHILDVIEPNVPVIGTAIVLHGGSYVRYDKEIVYESEYIGIVAGLLNKGVRVVNANYRYLGENGILDPLTDGQLIVDYVRNNYDGKIAMGGVSAGAGISLYTGLTGDVDGIFALEMQDLNVREWESVFPELNIDQALAIPTFADLYAAMYVGQDPEPLSLRNLVGNGTPIYLLNTVDNPFSLFDTDNLYHNIGHAQVFAVTAAQAGHPVVTGDLIEFITNILN